MFTYQINHPKNHVPVKLKKFPGVIVASGRTDDSCVQITATCEFTKPHTPPVPRIDMLRTDLRLIVTKNSANPYRPWFIAFRLPEKGEYTLVLTMAYHGGDPTTVRHDFSVKERPPVHPIDPSFLPIASITYAPLNEHIDANDFTAYGETTNTLRTITLYEKESTKYVNLGYGFEDVVQQIWYQQFDVLTVGNHYTLEVLDDGGISDMSDNLTAV